MTLPRCFVCSRPGATLRYLLAGEPWWVHPLCWAQVRGEFVEQAK